MSRTVPGTVVARNQAGIDRARSVLSLEDGEPTPTWVVCAGAVEPAPEHAQPGFTWVRWTGTDEAAPIRNEYIEETS